MCFSFPSHPSFELDDFAAGKAEMTVRVTESLSKSKRLWFGVLWLSSLLDFVVGIQEKTKGAPMPPPPRASSPSSQISCGQQSGRRAHPLAELHNEVNDIVVLTGFAEWHDSGTLGKVAHDGNLAADILDVDSCPELPEQPRLEMLLRASSSRVSRSMQR
ncbi:uncharacterized protein HKW66_Vig0218420 [Vigna angularis]|uniref:Uncharacterized protein n=1 Tax=Phaseolus angularis TaxID=3914 RepID=A0A8T0JFZ9_PHAAN|nr:uncharacterized protein HKW66_Vig0218420 [Vigna angularis]